MWRLFILRLVVGIGMIKGLLPEQERIKEFVIESIPGLC